MGGQDIISIVVMTPAQIKREKIDQETARIEWRELERLFAAGRVIAVSPTLDLVEVALQMSQDNVAQIKQWMKQDQLGQVTDEQAQHWAGSYTELWAVVVKPWVLVQEDRKQKES